jgi:hypothetical protein
MQLNRLKSSWHMPHMNPTKYTKQCDFSIQLAFGHAAYEASNMV